jgi:hypothetical protein
VNSYNPRSSDGDFNNPKLLQSTIAPARAATVVYADPASPKRGKRNEEAKVSTLNEKTYDKYETPHRLLQINDRFVSDEQ